MDTLKSARLSRWWGSCVVACLVWSGISYAAAPAAVASETDDTRLGADRIEIGASVRGTMAPPTDSVDWLYFELEEESTLKLGLDRREGDGTLRMNLSKATGEDIGDVDTSGGSGSLELTLAPGLYYIELTADAAATYMLTVAKRKKPPSR